jgi:hypothetical protein
VSGHVGKDRYHFGKKKLGLRVSVGEKRERVLLKGFFKNKPVRKDESIAIEPF